MKKSDAKPCRPSAPCEKKAPSSEPRKRHPNIPPPSAHRPRAPKPNRGKPLPFKSLYLACYKHNHLTAAIALQTNSVFHTFLRNLHRRAITLSNDSRFFNAEYALPLTTKALFVYVHTLQIPTYDYDLTRFTSKDATDEYCIHVHIMRDGVFFSAYIQEEGEEITFNSVITPWEELGVE